MRVRTKFSYHIDCIGFGKQNRKNMWHIPNDAPKSVVIKRSKRMFTNWISKLVTSYVEVGTTPFVAYPYLDEEHWNTFVAKKTSPEFLFEQQEHVSIPQAPVHQARVPQAPVLQAHVSMCKQQSGSWECGFMVMKNMLQFVMQQQNTLPTDIRNDTSHVTQPEIDSLIGNIMKQFFIKNNMMLSRMAAISAMLAISAVVWIKSEAVNQTTSNLTLLFDTLAFGAGMKPL
ncbi:hypothetical protein QVD17_16954 [Tagetes erecta]|uniref:Uncharacterized protein n=1 Tax=Tagetes erecta TaxID=13708 RepID=A0AAD8KVS8_TARER|nr:hypothetical protein QVD17_16954 [Tagetes erecta]